MLGARAALPFSTASTVKTTSAATDTTDICIVGCGPVGMVLATMLQNRFGRKCIVLERADQLQNHPKAHYLGFRTCEILGDLDPRL